MKIHLFTINVYLCENCVGDLEETNDLDELGNIDSQVIAFKLGTPTLTLMKIPKRWQRDYLSDCISIIPLVLQSRDLVMRTLHLWTVALLGLDGQYDLGSLHGMAKSITATWLKPTKNVLQFELIALERFQGKTKFQGGWLKSVASTNGILDWKLDGS